MSTEAAYKTGVVLSGGGANGAYEVGVLKALLTGKCPSLAGRPLAPDLFAGTSIGSFNATFMVAQWDTYGPAVAGNLEAAWLERLSGTAMRANGGYRFRFDPIDWLTPSRYLPNPLQPLLQLVQDGAHLSWEGMKRAVNFATESEAGLRQRLAEIVDFTAFVSTEPWERTIRESIDFALVRSSSRALRIAATNWTTGKLRIFHNYHMTDRMGTLAVMASSAIPGVFPPVFVGAEPHVDGGVLLNSPLKLVTDEGAEEVHVVYLDPDVAAIPFSALESTVATLYRQQIVSWAQRVNDDVEDAAIINRGIETLGRAERGELGERDAELVVLAKSVPKFWVRFQRHLRYRPLTVHRYHPRDELGGGPLGMLNLDRNHIEELIARGFSDASMHNCKESGCILPAAGAEPSAGRPAA